MKTIIITLLLSCSICYGQRKENVYDTVLNYKPFYGMIAKVNDKLYIYNTHDRWQLIKEDSTRYYFKQYIILKNKSIPDSLNKFYKKLNSKNKN
jgi:hypothetical protein